MARKKKPQLDMFDTELTAPVDIQATPPKAQGPKVGFEPWRYDYKLGKLIPGQKIVCPVPSCGSEVLMMRDGRFWCTNEQCGWSGSFVRRD